jgi:hypothetical protein
VAQIYDTPAIEENHILVEKEFPMKTQFALKHPTSLHITAQDSHVLYTFPGGMFPLSTSDFTLNLWYKTSHTPEVQDPVAIFSNVRHTQDADQYGRHFMLMLQPSGVVSLEFSAGDYDEPYSTTNSHGSVESNNKIDDAQWHQITVIRSWEHEKMSLYIDCREQASMRMTTGLDIDSQEQHIVIGGGNDRHFRDCFLYEMSFWGLAMGIPPMDCAAWQENSRALLFHFSFSEHNIIDNFLVKDISPTRGDAIITSSAGVSLSEEAPNPGNVAVMGSWCRSRVRTDTSDLFGPVNDTVIITSLPKSCEDGKDELLAVGSFWYIDAYILGMWLDANRLRYTMLILTGSCLPQGIVQKYTTKYVRFLREREDLGWQPPPDCDLDTCFHGNEFARMWIARWFIELYLIQKTDLLSTYSHLVAVDLRDSRIYRQVEWPSSSHYTFEKPELWMQGMDIAEGGPRSRTGGFHAGSKSNVEKLLVELTAMFLTHRCNIDDQYGINQHVLSFPEGDPNILSMVQLGAPLVNTQKTRVFSGPVFTHGCWWMNKRLGVGAKMAVVYPNGIVQLMH